jgi:D-3-phosphoglycerate dehydrogenase
MTKHHILIATDLTDESLALLDQAENITYESVVPKAELVREHIGEAHALITREDLSVDITLLDQAPNLRIIAQATAGMNNVDLETATARGIMVMNTPGVNAIAAAEHTMALMLALSRKVITAHDSLREGYWLLDRKRQAGTQLFGKTLGIIGLGRVGRLVANRALGFGMDVLAFDPYVAEDQIPDERVRLVGRKDLLQNSDYITVHVPATRETKKMIDEAFIEQMKAGSRLINTAHGSIVNDGALADAVKSGHLAGAAVDVYDHEPPYNSPLIGLDQVVHTPHIGDNTIEAMQDLSLNVIQQVIDALQDRDYRHVVNMPLLPGMDYATIRPYLRLSNAMGLMLRSLARSPIRRVAVEVQGDELNGLIKLVTVGILQGLLTPILGQNVSSVNAPVLAHERGWQVTQVKGLKGRTIQQCHAMPNCARRWRRNHNYRYSARPQRTPYRTNQCLSPEFHPIWTFIGDGKY